jgi:hypothetical protein
LELGVPPVFSKQETMRFFVGSVSAIVEALEKTHFKDNDRKPHSLFVFFLSPLSVCLPSGNIRSKAEAISPRHHPIHDPSSHVSSEHHGPAKDSYLPPYQPWMVWISCPLGHHSVGLIPTSTTHRISTIATHMLGRTTKTMEMVIPKSILRILLLILAMATTTTTTTTTSTRITTTNDNAYYYE